MKLSVKLGIIFFLIIFGLESFMFFFLHSALVDNRVEEELNGLLARGNSHRSVLEMNFDKTTISHITLMESEADTDVVITDSDLNFIGSSNQSIHFSKYIQSKTHDIPRHGKVIENNWRKTPFIATVSPIEIDKQVVGYVYMFQDTASVQSLIKHLNEHFLLAGFISIALTFFIIIVLSKALTKPLLEMKEATSQISNGNYTVSLPKVANDELGDLANSIQLLAQKLNYLTKERNDFLASISHELRTPLTYIKGYTDIVHKRNLPREEQEKYLEIIIEETTRLSVLIKELFVLAKFDQNTFVIQKQQIDLHEFLNNIEQKLSPAFKEKDRVLDVFCPENLFLMADPARLEQIFLNLLDNAMKYSSSGDKTVLRVIRKGTNCHISISDTGKGIPEKDIPHIFDRFYRVDKSRTRTLGGSGLGLAIVRELIHAHGGTIEVKSKENIGTQFELIFKGAIG
ncbi:ATP-binding protein [Neobacillus sp. D3-1R]|uniref:sensor histidine kinase n=1 Tax=Neobacillus sp. D3-1R TaxID=3445778 RepID=UPI003FA1595F